MNTAYIFIGQGLLTLLSCFFAYRLGRAAEREKYEKQKAISVSAAKRAREALCDPAAVGRLHAKYKR